MDSVVNSELPFGSEGLWRSSCHLTTSRTSGWRPKWICILASPLSDVNIEMSQTGIGGKCSSRPARWRIYKRLSMNPGDNRTLEKWGNVVGATGRTLTRRFRSETGMSFGQWRQQVRILEALKRLAMNEPVTTVAMELGYDSPSAFISMFKKALGKTPGQYFAG